MQWLGLQRNSKAKSHGSCCWHAEEAFPLASSLLSTSFAEAAQAARLWGCPWLLASTCIVSPGQEVTNHKRLAKAAPSRTNIFITVSFHCQESTGATAQCICLLFFLLAASIFSVSCAPAMAAIPVYLLCPAYYLVSSMAKALVAGGGISPKAIFPICKTCSLSKARFFAISFIASSH